MSNFAFKQQGFTPIPIDKEIYLHTIAPLKLTHVQQTFAIPVNQYGFWLAPNFYFIEDKGNICYSVDLGEHPHVI